MAFEGNANGKLSEKKMEEEEDSLIKVECLRGRLLAERVASRNARQEAENMGNKMIELENKLRKETKSRNKAEKKLKFLIKKLESKNISYISQDIECQESVGSTKSSYENVGNICSSLRCSDSSNILSYSYEISQKCTKLEEFDVDSETLLKSSNDLAKLHCAKSREFEFSKSDGNRIEIRVFRKQPHFYEVMVRFAYILSSPHIICGISPVMLLLYQIILTYCSR